MIATILRVHWINLRRDRIAWLLTFFVPIAFFSFFAIIFGGMGRSSTSKVRIAVADEDRSDVTRRLLVALAKEESLHLWHSPEVKGDSSKDGDTVMSRDEVEKLVRDGDVSAAIVFPKGLGQSFGKFENQGPEVVVLADTSDPVAPQMVGGLLQKVAMTAAPDLFMQSGIDQLKRWGGPLSEAQRKAVETGIRLLHKDVDRDDKAAQGEANALGSFGLIGVKVVDLLGEKKANPIVAFYAASTAVMFLLFMCANAAGGSLLEEVESGTLDRLLSSNLGMNRLLLGKWLSLTLLGILQVTVMFLWGALVFRVELWSHLIGFILMTTATAAAGAAFGLVLATLCKSRGQLAGISTTVILLMSALGGCMFPRVLMSEKMQQLGLLTFNGWALDGYVKIFWRDVPLWEIWPQLLVLTGLTAVFLGCARQFARRWELS